MSKGNQLLKKTKVMPSRKNNASNIILRSPLPSYDANNGEKGCNICGFCNICVCLRWGFLSSPTGILKAIELVSKRQDHRSDFYAVRGDASKRVN